MTAHSVIPVYWTQEQSDSPHAFIFAIDLVILGATILALQYLDLRNKKNTRIIYLGVLSSFLNALITYLLDIKLFGELSDRLYLVASIFYLGTWINYLYLIWIESNAVGNIAKEERRLITITFVISAAGLIPAVGFFLQATVVGYSYIQVYYWGIPVVLFNPVFDMTVLYLLKTRLYNPKGWTIAPHIKVSVTLMILLKIWLLLIVFAPILPLYCQFEEVAMHIAVLTVVMIFIEIQQKFRFQNATFKGSGKGSGISATKKSIVYISTRSAFGSRSSVDKGQSNLQASVDNLAKAGIRGSVENIAGTRVALPGNGGKNARLSRLGSSKPELDVEKSDKLTPS